MKNVSLYRRILSVVLSLALLSSLVVPAAAAGRSADPTSEQLTLRPVGGRNLSPVKIGGVKGAQAIEAEPYGFTDIVRVSIFLDGKSTLEAGFSQEGIAADKRAAAYRGALKQEQAGVTARIEKAIGSALDVKWNLTLAANLISANVRYGDIGTIRSVKGVAAVEIENRYDPLETEKGGDSPKMSNSSLTVGSQIAWAQGYTGAGSIVAVIDTGIDEDHISFDGAALEYALAQNVAETRGSLDDYLASLDLLTADKVAAVADQLNVTVDPDTAYLSTKLPFAYNYVDENYNVSHMLDAGSEHGSHVAGIAAANRFVPSAEGFEPALDTVLTQGVAPDAQLLVMKVFGQGGGAYDSDYMAAIEDAIVMGADSINVSIGSANPGAAISDRYQQLMDSLTEKGAVVAIAAGNSGHWNDTPFSKDFGLAGYLYLEDVSTDTVGSPGSYENALTVASADNNGATGMPLKVGDSFIFYNESAYRNRPIATLPGEHEYVFIDGTGSAEEWDGIDLTGKIAVCSRGTITFTEKAENAAAAGAIATIIYNNTDGAINMDLSTYTKEVPVISVTQEAGGILREAAAPVYGDGEDPLYYVGALTVTDAPEVLHGDPDALISMSSYSSWGVTGALTLKPEITAPGGNIYGVNGEHLNEDGKSYSGGKDQYELMSGTSMASPQVAGMAAVLSQYVRENGLEEKTGLSARQLINSLLMSTADPMFEDYGDDGVGYYPVLRQGSGLANVGKAISARSYLLMDSGSTMFPSSAGDGKVKAELGDDPDRIGSYQFSFTLNSIGDKDQEYALSTDLFTQSLFAYYTDAAQSDISWYMDNWTMPFSPLVAYTVDGTQFDPVADCDADVNMDGVTDTADAQYILEYLASNINEETDPFDSGAADADWDGEITSHDAYYILQNLEPVTFTAPAGGSVEITVDIQLDPYEMIILDYYFVNGAYIEGFTYVTPLADEEGEIGDAVHSIPILGFYGNWTDSSMFDSGNVIDSTYGGLERVPYTGNFMDGLQIRYEGDKDSLWVLGNPYLEEDSFPAERLALRSSTTLSLFRYNAIRSGSLVTAVTDGEDQVIWMGGVSSASAAFYNINKAKWQDNETVTALIGKTVGSLGLEDGDAFTVGLYLAPQYYNVRAAKEKGSDSYSYLLSAAEYKALIESGDLGGGAAMSYTFTLDDTAPQVVGASRDLIDNKMTVTARDNNYIAYLAVYNSLGSFLYASALPEQSAAGEVTVTELDFGDVKLPGKVWILVADYAGNETVCEVSLGGQEDMSGKLFAYSFDGSRGAGSSWMTVDPETVYYASEKDFGGTEFYAAANNIVYAAAYADGYVFMADADGYVYAAPLDQIEATQKVCWYGDQINSILAIAYNEADGQIYLLDNMGYVWTMDPVTGELTFAFSVELNNPAVTGYYNGFLMNMTVAPDGTFYAVNFGNAEESFLYAWTLDDVENNAVELTPVTPTAEGSTGAPCTNYLGGLAWLDGTLYWANSIGSKGDAEQMLLKFDLATGKAVPANAGFVGDNGAPAEAAGVMYTAVSGLFAVPSEGKLAEPTDTALSLDIYPQVLDLLKGQTAALEADVYPWTLTDKTLIWTSSDDGVATVDQNGAVTAVEAGDAVITVTTAAAPGLTAECAVHVDPIPQVDLNGLIFGADSVPVMAAFKSDRPADYTVLAQALNVKAGALYDDETLYFCSEDTVYAMDADTFEITQLGSVSADWIFTDACGVPAQYSDAFGGKILGVCHSGSYVEILNPEKGSLRYWDLSESEFGKDPLVAIAFGSLLPSYENEEGATFTDAFSCYALTAGGELFYLVFFGGNSLEWYDYGGTGLDLSGVKAGTDQSASMFYDEDTGFIFLSDYLEGDTATLYVIDSDDAAVCVPAGNFGSAVWPVVSLYRHEQLTDLTLKLEQSSLTIYESGSRQLKYKVKMGETNKVTFQSDDESVAAVDENGLITAVAPGTATVTVTTVDTNGAGEHLTAVCRVTVKEYARINKSIIGQVSTADGNTFSAITLTGPEARKVSDAPAAFQAGARLGDLYLAKVDKAPVTLNARTLEPADYFADASAFNLYPPMDIANYPDFPDADDNLVSKQAMFILEEGWLVDPYFNGWNLSDYFPDMAGLAFGGYYVDSSETLIFVYYMVTASGGLYEFDLEPVAGDLSLYELADLELTFRQDKVSLAYVEDVSDPQNIIAGLVLADNSNQDVYFIDMMPYYNNVAYPEAALVGRLDSLNVTGLVGTFDYVYSVLEEADPEPGTEPEPDPEPDFEPGPNETPIQSVRSGAGMAGRLNRVATAHTASAGIPMAAAGACLKSTRLGESANLSAGSLTGLRQTGSAGIGRSREAADLMALLPEVQAAQGEVTVTLSEELPVTNGLITVAYDPDELTFTGFTSQLPFRAFHVSDEPAGTIVFSYANAREIPAGAALAELSFSYTGVYVDSQICVTSVERNGELDLSENQFVGVGQEDAHTYGDPVWTWAEDYSTASASFTCVREDDVRNLTAAVGSETTPATCTEDGRTVYTATVEFGGATYTDVQTVVIPATGHSYGEPTWKWAPDGSMAVASFACERGDYVQKVAAEVITAQTTAPTHPGAGQKVFTAVIVFNGAEYTGTFTVAIPAEGHTYGEPVWTWTEDNTATAAFTCAGEDDTQRVTAIVTYQTTPATCTAEGQTVYTAMAAFNGRVYMDKKTVTIPAEGHTYGEPVWTWTEDNTATAAFACKSGDDTQTLTAAVEAQTTPATNLAAGKTVYTATVEFGGKTYTDEKTVEIPVIPLEKEALQKAVEEALTEEQLAGYTPDSVQKYKDALAAARKALEEAAAQEELDAAAAALAAAQNALAKPAYTPGDVDGDGEVTSTDARLVLQLSVEKIGESDLPVAAAADVDGDGEITSTDARLILQYSVGKIDGFPVGIPQGHDETPIQ